MSNFWDDAGAVLAKVAPVLGTAIGGPIGGVAVKAVASALGLDESTPPQDVAAAVTAANPDQLLALKQAEIDFALAVKKLHLSSEQVAAEDRASARNRETATRDATPKLLTLFVTGGFFTLLGILCFVEISPSNAAILQIMLGALGAAFMSPITYYFGSSADVSQTHEAIKSLTLKP